MLESIAKVTLVGLSTILLSGTAMQLSNPFAKKDKEKAKTVVVQQSKDVNTTKVEQNPIDNDFKDYFHQRKVRYIDYPLSGVLVGQGWDSFSSMPSHQKCLVFQEQIIPGHDIQITAENISSRYQLNKSLKLSMSGSYSGYGVKASAKASYSNSLDIDQNKTNILSKIDIWKGDIYAAPSFIDHGNTERNLNDQSYYPIELTSNALKWAKEDPLLFRKYCGDSFVSHIRNGASLNAYLTFDALSVEEKKRLSATISASGWGAKFKGSMDSSERVKNESENTNIRMFQTGGYLHPAPLNIEDFKNTVKDFTKSTDPNYFPVKPYEIGLLSYAGLPNWPHKEGLANPDSMIELYSLYWLYDDLRKEYLDALTSPKDFYLVEIIDQAQDLYNKDKAKTGTITVATDDGAICHYRSEKNDVERRVLVTRRPIHEGWPTAYRTTRRVVTNYTGEAVWTLKDSQPANCPEGASLAKSIPYDIDNVISNLLEITSIQENLNLAIKNCANGQESFSACSSRDAFKLRSSRFLSQMMSPQYLNANDTFKKISNQEVGFLTELMLEAMEARNQVREENLFTVIEKQANSLNKVLSKAIANVSANASFETTNSSNTTISFQRPRDGTGQSDNIARMMAEVTPVLEDGVENSFIITSNAIEGKMTVDEANRLLTDLTAKAELATHLSEIKQDEAFKVLGKTITTKYIASKQVPDVWPFSLTNLESESDLNVDDSWKKLVEQYYVFRAKTPVRITYTNADNTRPIKSGYKKSGNQTNQASIDAYSTKVQKSIRKEKLNSLLELSESFCGDDIMSSLCLNLDEVRQHLDSANLWALTQSTSTPVTKYDHYRDCHNHWDLGVFKRRHCKTRTTSRIVTEYINNIVSDEEIDL